MFFSFHLHLGWGDDGWWFDNDRQLGGSFQPPNARAYSAGALGGITNGGLQWGGLLWSLDRLCHVAGFCVLWPRFGSVLSFFLSFFLFFLSLSLSLSPSS